MLDSAVVDATVFASIFLREEGWSAHASKLADLTVVCSVPFFRYEVANAVWKHREIPGSQAVTLTRMVFNFAVDDAFPPEQSQLATRIARKHRLPFYDSAYIAQAQARGLPLWTLDRGQAAAARLEKVALL